MITTDTDAVETGHALGRIGDDVPDDAHRGFGRINIGVAHHVFFQNIVLNRSRQLLGLHALLFPGNDISREDRNHSAVHRHGYAHFFERDLIEKDLHILDRVNGHTGFSHIPHHTRMIRIIAAMRSQIEGDRQSHLARSEVLPIKGVGFLGRGKARVLANSPGFDSIHRGSRAARIGRKTGQGIQRLHRFQILGGIQCFDRDTFWSLSGQSFERCRTKILASQVLPGGLILAACAIGVAHICVLMSALLRMNKPAAAPRTNKNVWDKALRSG